MVRCSLLFSILWLLFSTSVLYAAEFQLSASRSKISINESVTLQLTAVGDVDGDLDLSALNADFDIINQSKSSNIQYINGEFSKSKVWNLILMPKRVGVLTIPALCSGSDCSNSTMLIVEQQNTNDNEAATVMLEAEVSSDNVVAQQQLIYTVRLLFRKSLLQAGLDELNPEGVETTVHPLGEDLRYEADRGNWRYQVIERKYALFPQHEGTLHLPPVRFNGQVESNNNSRSNSPFGGLRQAGEVVRLRSDAIDVSVSAPPLASAQQPWLPAEKVVINDDWQQSAPTLTVGEPATRTIVTIATGLTAAQLPELTLVAPASFKSYPDKTVRKDNLTESGLAGIVEQKVAFVPTEAGTFSLPEIQLKWWDIGKKKWQTAGTEALSIEVLPGQRVASTISHNVNQPQPLPPAPESAAIQDVTAPDKAVTTSGSNNYLVWIWSSVVCASGWMITLVLLLRLRNRQAEETVDKSAVLASNNMSKSKSRAELIRTAKSNDPVKTRTALLVWIQEVSSDVDAETFIKTLDLPLQLQIEGLNSALYSSADGAVWMGEELAHELERWSEGASKATESSLPDFYPQ